MKEKLITYALLFAARYIWNWLAPLLYRLFVNPEDSVKTGKNEIRGAELSKILKEEAPGVDVSIVDVVDGFIQYHYYKGKNDPAPILNKRAYVRVAYDTYKAKLGELPSIETTEIRDLIEYVNGRLAVVTDTGEAKIPVDYKIAKEGYIA